MTFKAFISPTIHVTFEKLQLKTIMHFSHFYCINILLQCLQSFKKIISIFPTACVMYIIVKTQSISFFLQHLSSWIGISPFLTREIAFMLKTTIPWVSTELWKQFLQICKYLTTVGTINNTTSYMNMSLISKCMYILLYIIKQTSLFK